MPKDPTEVQQLKEIMLEVVYEAVGKSHQAVASVQSDGYGEIKTKLAIHTEVLEEIRNYQKTQNGNVAKAVKEIEELKAENTKRRMENAEVRTTAFNIKWLGGLVIGLVFAIGLYAYKNDFKNADYKIEQVQASIKEHDTKDNAKYQELINLLKHNATN